MCFYWIEWIMQFCANCKKKKMILKCESRTFIDVEFKYKEDVIWIIWEIFMKLAQKKKNIFKNIKILLIRILFFLKQNNCLIIVNY